MFVDTNIRKGYYNSKEGFNLKWDVEQAPTRVMVGCPQTFNHLVFVSECLGAETLLQNSH